MVDDKKKEEIQKRVQHYLNEGILEKGNKEFVEFFLENAKKSLETAELLYEISTKEEMQKNMHYPNFDGLPLREKNLTLLGDTEKGLMDAIKNGKLLPENTKLKKEVSVRRFGIFI